MRQNVSCSKTSYVLEGDWRSRYLGLVYNIRIKRKIPFQATCPQVYLTYAMLH